MVVVVSACFLLLPGTAGPVVVVVSCACCCAASSCSFFNEVGSAASVGSFFTGLLGTTIAGPGTAGAAAFSPLPSLSAPSSSSDS